MQRYTSLPFFSDQEQTSEPDAAPVVITQKDFDALGDEEPGTDAARRLLGSMGLVGGGMEKVVIVDAETGDIVKEGRLNTADNDFGTFERPVLKAEIPELVNSAHEDEPDNDIDVLEQTLKHIHLSELLKKAGNALEASGESDIALTRNLSGRLNEDLIALRSRLMRADSEGPWQGNRLRGHAQLKRQIEDYVSQALRSVPTEDDRNPSGEGRLTKLLKRELDDACEELASIVGQDDNAKPLVSQLHELAYNYGNASSIKIDTSVLRRNLLNLRGAIDDSQITVSDVVSSVSAISRAIEECVARGRSVSMKKSQVVGELRSLDKRL